MRNGALQIIPKGINYIHSPRSCIHSSFHEHLIMLRNISWVWKCLSRQISSSTITGIQTITGNMKHLAFLIFFTGIAISYLKNLHLILPRPQPSIQSFHWERESFPQILGKRYRHCTTREATRRHSIIQLYYVTIFFNRFYKDTAHR